MADSTLAQWLAPLSLASDAGAALPWERGLSAALVQTISEAVHESRSLAPPGGGVEAGGGRRYKRVEPGLLGPSSIA
jgi:hypothetical protein